MNAPLSTDRLLWPKLRGKQSLCTGCMQVFRTVSGFDKHRYGPVTERRCLDVQQLADKGWRQTDKGIWIQPASKTGWAVKAA